MLAVGAALAAASGAALGASGCSFDRAGATALVDLFANAAVDIGPSDGDAGDRAAPGSDGAADVGAAADVVGAPDACVLTDGGAAPAQITASAGSVTIDGDLGDWRCARFYSLDAAGADFVFNWGTQPPTSSASWALQWDASALFVAVRVVDDKIAGTHVPRLYENDSVELFVDGDGKVTGDYGADTAQLIVDHAGRRTRGPNPPTPNPPGFVAAVKVTAYGYAVEARIDAALLGRSALSAGDQLAFDIALNDNDGRGGGDGLRETQIVWRDRGQVSCTCSSCCCGQPGDEPWCNSLHFAPLRLVP